MKIKLIPQVKLTLKRSTYLVLIGFFIVVAPITILAQERYEKEPILMYEPYFFKNRLKNIDSLFLKDVSILKGKLEFDSLDVEILSPSVLKFIFNDYSNHKLKPTYATLIDALIWFKTSLAYIEFRKSVTIFKKMEKLKVNVDNWEVDKELFERLGFTVNDLEDFKLFISEASHTHLTYKQAYLAYMDYINSL